MRMEVRMAKHTVAKAAKLVRKSQDTIYRKIKNGKISSSKDGDGRSVVDTSELIRVFGDLDVNANANKALHANESGPVRLHDLQENQSLRLQLDNANARIEEYKDRIKRHEKLEDEHLATIAVFRHGLLGFKPNKEKIPPQPEENQQIDVEGMFRKPKKKGKKGKKGKKK